MGNKLEELREALRNTPIGIGVYGPVYLLEEGVDNILQACADADMGFIEAEKDDYIGRFIPLRELLKEVKSD